MTQKKMNKNQQKETHPNEGRRNFLKQTSLMTALIATPLFLVKAAASMAPLTEGSAPECWWKTTTDAGYKTIFGSK